MKGKVPFVAVLIVVLVFVFISLDPPQVLFGIFLAYGVSGPAITLITLRKRKAERLQQQQDETSEPEELSDFVDSTGDESAEKDVEPENPRETPPPDKAE